MNLHELLLNPGSRLPFRCELSTDRLDFPAVLSYTAAPVGEGFIVNNAGALTLRGTLSAAMRCVCDRCAAEFDREVSYPLDVPLASELQDEENPDYFLLEGDELDLEELLETVFILNTVSDRVHPEHGHPVSLPGRLQGALLPLRQESQRRPLRLQDRIGSKTGCFGTAVGR